MTFNEDIAHNLLQKQKRLPVEYLYDDMGSQLFDDITTLPEYYQTRCEYDILSRHIEAICNLVGPAVEMLCELGAGSGYKSKIILEHWLAQYSDIVYAPIDISKKAIDDLKKALSHLNVSCLPIVSTYFEGLKDLKLSSDKKKLVLFLGSSIGNLDAQAFLIQLRSHMNRGDYLFTGFDLCKDPNTLIAAYNDSTRITDKFTVNILNRINRECGADFNLDKFKYYVYYDPYMTCVRTGILSLEKQQVQLKHPKISVPFEPWECIAVGVIKKYYISDIQEFAHNSGFEVLDNYFDSKGYFVDSLWRAL